MKGIVFTEFIEMVESTFGIVVTDRILEPEGLASEGVFTAVGTYEDRDMVLLIQRLGKETGVPLEDLEFKFGDYLFGTFARGYAEMLKRFSTTFGLLSHLDDFIHPEVQKLYPDAALPGFEVTQRSDTNLELIYRSHRKMPHFARGLMLAAARHFGEEITVECEPSTERDDMFTFRLEKTG